MNRIKILAKWFSLSLAHHITMAISFRYAKTFPIYFVVGFPRSGTSWLSELISDYYNLPRPRHYYLPIAFASVIHTHYKPSKRFKNTFYIYRDGRDAYYSSFVKTIKLIKNDPTYKNANYYKELFKNNYDNIEDKENFYLFLKDEFNKKHIWSDHVQLWLDAQKTNKEISTLSFENLKNEPNIELGKAITSLDGNVNTVLLENIIFINSFEEQAKRPVSQHRTVLHKGDSKNWTKIFNKNSALIFEEKCGKLLIDLGYEQDNSWVNKFKD